MDFLSAAGVLIGAAGCWLLLAVLVGISAGIAAHLHRRGW